MSVNTGATLETRVINSLGYKSMKSSNQSGLAHIVVILTVVVLAAIGGVGYLVFTKNDSGRTPNSSLTSASLDSAESKKVADEKAVKAAAKEHFALVYQKKLEEAYKITCQNFRDLTAYSEFQSYLSNPGFQTIDLSVIEYTSIDIRNNQAKISGPVGPLDPNSTLSVSLLAKDSQWCVYGYEIE